MRLEGKVAFVTGAAQGLGEEIARTFVREGAKVYLADLKSDKGRALAQELGPGQAVFVPLDVTEESSWVKALDVVKAAEGKLDILVNNAGISIRKPLEEFPVEDWDRMMAVNVRGVFLGMKHAIPVMRASGGGAIVNMSSIAGLVGHATSSEAYIASKGAVTLMTKGAATHFAAHGIRVNSIHPCTVDTPLVADLFADPEMKKARYAEVPMGRLATPADVAGAVLFLASDEAAFLTGVALPVDGGLTAC